MTKFVFPAEALSQHLAIVGKTGSGKTYAAKGLVEHLLDAQRRVCILDPTGAWYGLRSSADGKKPGFPVAVFGGAHGDVPIAEHSGGTLAKILAEKNLPAIVDLSEMLIGQRHRFVTDFAEAIYRDNRSPLHLIIDEADEFIPQNPLPETKRMLHHIDRIIRRGRIRGFRVMMITQRPAVIHKNALTQANTLITMRLTAPQDRKAIQAWIEGNGDAATGRTVLDSLARLQRGDGWIWSPEIGVLERTTFPKIKTFDSSRTPDDDDVIAEPTQLAAVDIREIRESFKDAEAAVTTLADLKAQNAKLVKDLAAAERRAAQAGVPETEVRKRVHEAMQAYVRDNPTARIGDDGKERKALQKILEIATKTLATGTLPPAPIATTGTTKALRVRPSAPIPSAGISGPEQRILDAIAWMEAIGVDQPEQPAVAFLADYAYGAGSYNNPRGKLNQAGLVAYLPGNRICLTDAGRAKANAPAAPATSAELQERVLARLPGPEQRVLRPLLDAYPKPMSNADLAAAANYAAGAGSFNNPRGRLRTLGLIDYPSPGMCIARSLLFPKVPNHG